MSLVRAAGSVIETRGLGKRYRGSWALSECSLTVPAGHVTALVGPNEAGKTTLLHALLRGFYLPPVHAAVLPRGALQVSGSVSGVGYQPLARFWPLQFVEAGGLLVVSALLAAAVVWLVRRRSA